MALNRAVQPTQVEYVARRAIGELRANNHTKAQRITKVVVRVVLRAVNLLDLFNSRQGIWKNLDLNNVVVGSEGVGVVSEVGEGFTKLKAGHRVVPLIFSLKYSRGYVVWRDYI